MHSAKLRFIQVLVVLVSFFVVSKNSGRCCHAEQKNPCSVSEKVSFHTLPRKRSDAILVSRNQTVNDKALNRR